MKQPIAWHEECLKNMRDSLKCAEAYAARVKADADRLRASVEACAAQIAEAKARKIDGFDPERFLVKKKSPKNTA